MSSSALARPFKYWVRRAALRIIRSAPEPPILKWDIVRGDTVHVLSGRSAGQTGRVQSVFRRKNRVVVEGLNLVKRHVKARPNAPGGVIAKESPIHYSNVALVDPPTGKQTRIAHRFTDDGARVRVSKRSGSIIPTPPEAIRKGTMTKVAGPKDTPQDVARKVTYAPPPELVAYLSRASELYRVRASDEALRKPEPVREGWVARKKNRNRILALWRRDSDKARMAELAETHGLPLPATLAARATSAGAAAVGALR